MTVLDYKNHHIAVIQEAFVRAGWRWYEETFDNGDVIIRFTLRKWCHAFNINKNDNYSEDCKYGWGRYPRYDAWVMAYDFLLGEMGTVEEMKELRKYKEKYSK